MGLVTYKKKRSFNKTPEPTGGKSSGTELRFVIQKHDARNLHYDFRLEMKGVLKSWAVPKGPSTDPSVKRLAMMVEDHPYDYRKFEGIIPKGQYGGGTVIIWDEGTYKPAEGTFDDKTQMEKNLLHQLHKGKIAFTLHGQKLKGDYALVKSSYQGDNSWLLMKVKDKYAKAGDITKKDKSVVSGKTIKQVEKTPGSVWQSNRDNGVDKKSTRSKKKTATKKKWGKKKKKASKSKTKAGKMVEKPIESEGWG